MKFNWGTGIVICFILFISFIMYFVINMATDKQYKHELVTKDYYKQELAFQDEINMEQKSADDKMQLTVTKTKNGLKVFFPEALNPEKISGNIFLYRPSNERLDFTYSIGTSSTHLLIPDKRLLDGRWNIKVLWKYQGKSYLYKKEITY
ncbi:FixH family protein [Ascidiimonas sp. W6]|uniref:FixH family protein n=1 Tax=Ascidiimonas meishanensis TaxID=3128903 RepID=UPI0030EF5E9C